jgi:uncharacterized protein (DUF1330 family)
MSHYAIFDVQILDLDRYKEYMAKVKPVIEAAGGRYLVRGGAHTTPCTRATGTRLDWSFSSLRARRPRAVSI